MKQEEAESICDTLFGEDWKTLSDALGLDHSTGWRLRKRALPAHKDVNGPVANALTAWAFLYRAFSILPPQNPHGSFNNEFGVEVEGAVEVIDVDKIAFDLFGKKWKIALSRALGINAATLWRQMTSDEGLPGPLVATLRAWQLIHKQTGLVPPYSLETQSSPYTAGAAKSKSRKSGYGSLLS